MTLRGAANITWEKGMSENTNPPLSESKLPTVLTSSGSLELPKGTPEWQRKLHESCLANLNRVAAEYRAEEEAKAKAKEANEPPA